MEDELVPGVSDLEAVARGRTSTVYRGTQRPSGQVVAVKILTSALADDAQRSRFERECRTVASLNGHPNIVTVHDAGLTAAGHPYLVTEFLPRSLADLVAEGGPLRWQEAVALGTEVAGALGVAHAHGVLHRDIAPRNILMAAGDVPKLADFAMARFAGAPDGASPGVSSFLAHAAPELVQGKPVDERSDIYSLASTLHEAMSGSAPFAAGPDDVVADDVMRVMDRIVMTTPPSLESSGVPAPIASVITAALAKDPGKRPPTADVFAQQLLAAAKAAGPATRVIGEDAVPAGPPAMVAGATGIGATRLGAATPQGPKGPAALRAAGLPGRRPPRRRGSLGAALAAVAVLLIAGAVAWAAGRSGDDTAETVPSTTVATTTSVAPTSGVPTTVIPLVAPFTVTFDLGAGTATLTGSASATDAASLRSAMGAVGQVTDSGLSIVGGPSGDAGATASSAATLLVAMQANLTEGTLVFDGRSFEISGRYRDEASLAALQRAIDATPVPVGRPQLEAAPPTTAGPTTTAADPGGEFRITSFTIETTTTESGSTTVRIPADGKKHSFTYDVQVAGLTADQYCPVRSGLTEHDGPGLSDLDLGGCFPPETPPNLITVRAFGAGTTTFTVWMCDGPSRGGTCPGAKSENGTEITVIAE